MFNSSNCSAIYILNIHPLQPFVILGLICEIIRSWLNFCVHQGAKRNFLQNFCIEVQNFEK